MKNYFLCTCQGHCTASQCEFSASSACCKLIDMAAVYVVNLKLFCLKMLKVCMLLLRCVVPVNFEMFSSIHEFSLYSI